MTKVAYNSCFGGCFSLSGKAIIRAREISGDPNWGSITFPRHDPVLIQVIEELGKAASGPDAELAIAEIPSGTEYRIDEKGGKESVETKDSYDWVIAP